MKKLMRRFSRVVDSPQYSQLRSDSRPRRSNTFSLLKLRRSSTGVPGGHLPVYVGEEMERYIVSAQLLSNPIFIHLLHKSAEEYGYEQEGVLRIPCNVLDFERVLQASRTGEITPEVQNILNNM